jgi:acyl dehydratase
MSQKIFSFDTLIPGEEVGRKEIVVTEELIKRHADAIGADRAWYLQDSPFGGIIAPPTLFVSETLKVVDDHYGRFGSIHAKQVWEFKKPVKLGDRVKVVVKIADKYVKRERAYVVFEFIAAGQDGEEYCRGLHTSLISMKKLLRSS